MEVMMTNYCSNGACKANAEWFYYTHGGNLKFLCEICRRAFEMGRENPEENPRPLDDLSGGDDDD